MLRTMTGRNALGITALVIACCFLQPATAAETNAATLKVATYNLRFASPSGPNSWPERRPLVKEVIATISPDVMGTQEGLDHQLRDIAADLPEYGWIGRGRDGGARGEFMAVFYRKARLLPLSTNHFWLSDTPEIPGSSTWGNQNRRMVTWIAFRDRQSGDAFALFNTHFDHEVQLAREKSAELLRSRIAAVSNNLPVIVTGDFNAAAGRNPAYATLTGDGFLTDTWTASPIRKNENLGTFNGFGAMPVNGTRIDWILTRGPIRTESIEIVPLKPGGSWPSDHLPVSAVLKIVSKTVE